MLQKAGELRAQMVLRFSAYASLRRAIDSRHASRYITASFAIALPSAVTPPFFSSFSFIISFSSFFLFHFFFFIDMLILLR